MKRDSSVGVSDALLTMRRANFGQMALISSPREVEILRRLAR